MATGLHKFNKRKREVDCSSSYEFEGNAAYSAVSQQVFIDLTDSQEPNDAPPFKIARTEPAGKKKPSAKKKVESKAVEEEPELCREQRDLVNLILSGANVFYTGSAGCGKSTVLKAFVKELRDKGLTVRIVAPTGRAAVDIGGQTLHTFAGLTPDSLKIPIETLRQKAWAKAVYKRFRETDVLVIDEISMVENHFLERVSEMIKEARGQNQAFGGMQVVLVGDFHQRKHSVHVLCTISDRQTVPPVKPFQFCITCGRENKQVIPGKLYKCPMHGEYRDDNKWAFRSKCWNEAKFICVNLTSIHRQKDPKFIALLEKCRQGMPFTQEERTVLLNHPCNVNKAVQLFATREEVRRVNEREFAKLKTEKRVFKGLDGILVREQHQQQLHWKTQRDNDGSLIALKEHRFERLLELKKGAQVILLVNLDLPSGLINGSQGVIVGWEDINEATLPLASDKDKTGTSMRQLLFGDHAHIKEDSIKQFVKVAPIKVWPIVKFDNGIKRAIMADCAVGELGDSSPYSVICRTQIPLLPAWAMSIHKSQGMTLSKVTVDLSRNFEEGQVYVALSRAKSLHGLKVLNLGEQHSGPNDEVISFLKEKFPAKLVTV
jgi:ATP-dependent DNA helicase PIF1